jgi:DNA (cytosine-5)-methyltransferase 1
MKIPYTMNDVYEGSSKELFTVITTFAGGGGSSTGYRLAGGKILLANEFVDEAVLTYKENYPETPVIPLDIREITSAKQVVKMFAEHGVKKGKLDLFDGSPPCSKFSVAGSMFDDKAEDELVPYSDKEQKREKFLIQDYVYCVLQSQPKVCVLENVPQMAPKGHGKSESPIFELAVERLRRHGYLVNWKILSATDYGVAQKRKRLFLVGVRPDIAKKVKIFDEEAILEECYPEPTKQNLTLRDVLKGVVIDQRERQMLLSNTINSSRRELVELLPKNPKKVVRLADITKDIKGNFSLERWCWDLPTRTLTQQGAQIPRCNYYHPDEDRPFTVAELRRVMGVPDDFVLTGSYNQKVERLGRMVPPLMTAALAKRLYERIFSKLE